MIQAARFLVAAASPLETTAWSLGPVLRNLTRLASASALPLYLAATDLNEGPFLSFSTSWHLVHFSALARAWAALASTSAEAVPAKPSARLLAGARAHLSLHV